MFRSQKIAILLGLALSAQFPARLFGQEHQKIGQLYFTKTYRGSDPLAQVVTVAGTVPGAAFTVSAQTSAGGDWLSISPAEECCISPAPLTVNVKPDAMLAAGHYAGQVVLTGSGNPQVIDVDLIVTSPGVPTFDRTPSQLSFSLQPGGEVLPQMMQISGAGQGNLSWTVIPSSNFLKVSVESGTAPTRISVGVVRENLPGAGEKSGVYTGTLQFVSAGSTTTVPVTVAVGDTELGWPHRLKAMKAAGTLAATATPAANPPNLFPANTANCFCGHFGNQDTGYGGLTLAPDGTNSGKQVGEANPGNGAVPHKEVLYQDLGAGTHTISFYLKPDSDTWAYLTSQVDTVVHNIWFNLSNGTPGNNTIPAGWVVHTPVSAGNGWYRYAVTFTAASSAVYNGFGLATADQQYAYTATNGQGIFEWGQQAENAAAPSAYSANETPCMSATVQRDAGVVTPGLQLGFWISTTNQATPSNATTLNAPLPGGSGINWSINPAFGGPGSCAISGALGSQSLACDFSVLAAGAGAAVHVTSNTSSSSCGPFSITATVTGGGVPLQASDTTTVQCAGPVLGVSKTHSGSFTQGQTGATYSVVVSNGGLKTTGTVTVTETLPAGLTLVSMSGTGWTCAGTTCSRDDALSQSASFPAITVTVNVASNAPSQVTNQVSASGGGSPTANASDTTTILPVGGHVPVFQSLSTPGGSGTSGIFSLQYSDVDGNAAFNRVQVVVNDYLRGFRSCLVYYTANADVMYLLDDLGGRWLGPIAFGNSGVLTNSQCALDMGRSTRVRSGNNLTLNLYFTFNPGFTGAKSVFTEAMDNSSQSLGWLTVGSYTVTASPNTLPVLNSVSPNTGTGTNAIFRFQLSDPDGGGDLDRLQVIIQNGFSAANSCYVYYAALSGLIYLASDNPVNFQGPALLGQSVTLQNSQCALRVGTSSVSYTGNTMVVNLDIAFKVPFAGAKTIYAETRDRSEGGANNWQTLGTWTAVGLVNLAPTVDSVTPSSGSGTTSTFTVQFSDGNGYSDLDRVQVLFNSSLNTGTGCLLQYVKGANLIYLLNDAGTGWVGPAMLGSSTPLQNTRCSLNVAGTTAVGTGNSLQMTLPMTFQSSSFSGLKNIYGEAVDSGGLDSNWRAIGTWTVQ